MNAFSDDLTVTLAAKVSGILCRRAGARGAPSHPALRHSEAQPGGLSDASAALQCRAPGPACSESRCKLPVTVTGEALKGPGRRDWIGPCSPAITESARPGNSDYILVDSNCDSTPAVTHDHRMTVARLGSLPG